uniref:Uncharacterized protein n=1 Tax=Amphora coffeiformis TaxID=265554 RepID=A0A7S3P3A4_9STRA
MFYTSAINLATMIVSILLCLFACPATLGFRQSSWPSNRAGLFPFRQEPPHNNHHVLSDGTTMRTTSRECWQLGRRKHRHGSKTTTRLPMVFDSLPPEIMEQISTQDVLDRILDESLRTSARKPIMIQFDPSSRAIWRHWRGTVFQETWRSAIRHAVWAAIVYFLFVRCPRVKSVFGGFNIIWAQILGVTTFTLTFFVNQSYSIWCRILGICRNLQGRLNDYLMAAAGLAQRNEDIQPKSATMPTLRRTSTASQYTETSIKLLRVQARYVRLFSILLYASLTRSHRPLLTPQGLRRMVARGLMTEEERAIIKQAAVPANTRHNVVLMWLFRTHLQGCKAGIIEGGAGLEVQLIRRVQEIRGLANGMESVLKGRMPFAYAHIVQVLVDATLWLYPFMIFSSDINLYLGFMGTLVLTTCYQGLFDLAKQFLDPFHNENFWLGSDALEVDTLIAETNANSVRWMNCLETMPMTTDDIASGRLDDFLLPEDGFTVEEAAQAAERERARQAQLEEQQREQQQQQQGRTTPALQKKAAKAAAEQEQEALLARLEVTAGELEETVAILNAQPGLDFVPGLDDEGESLQYHKSYGRSNVTDMLDDADDDDDNELVDQFRETAVSQLREVKELVEGGESGSTPIL